MKDVPLNQLLDSLDEAVQTLSLVKAMKVPRKRALKLMPNGVLRGRITFTKEFKQTFIGYMQKNISSLKSEILRRMPPKNE